MAGRGSVAIHSSPLPPLHLHRHHLRCALQDGDDLNIAGAGAAFVRIAIGSATAASALRTIRQWRNLGITCAGAACVLASACSTAFPGEGLNIVSFPGNGLSIFSFFADDGSSLEIKRRLDPYGSSQEEIEKKHGGEVGTGQATLLRFGHGA